MILEQTITVRALKDFTYFNHEYAQDEQAEIYIQDIVYVVENEFATIVEPKMRKAYEIAKNNFKNKNKGRSNDEQ